MSVNIIYGPPGTGKTTELLNVVELLLEDGFNSTEIGFIAFTRKAANVAKTRAMEKFSLHEDNLPWFRTLHSLAFHQQALSKDKVMGVNDYINICNQLGLRITFKGVNEDGTFSGLTKGDRLFFMENMSRATKVSLREYWEARPDEDVYWYELERLHETIKQYKIENDRMDFTDIIVNFIETKTLCPPIKILIVDEAQDLSPLQWDMVELLMNNVDEVYIAGDDDQAIFRWAGADIDKFINLEGDRRVLDRSYRCPQVIQDLALDIASKIITRVPKIWKPRSKGGVVERVTSVEHVDMSKGTWFLLARNVYLLQQFNDHCIQQGYVFDSSLGSPVRGSSFVCIKHWEELRKGKSIRFSQAKKIYDLMTTKIGVAYGFKTKIEKEQDTGMVDIKRLKAEFGLTTDAIWHIALDKLTPQEAEYFIAALKRGEKLLKEPRIKISTIHGVKGGEADNVLLCPDMAQRTYQEFQQMPDDEWRVWYVGVTRARERVLILSPQTNICIDI